MIIKIKKGIIYSIEEGVETPIGSIFDAVPLEQEREIECAAEVLPAVKDFIEQVNTGTFKPRAAVKKFEQILSKHAV